MGDVVSKIEDQEANWNSSGVCVTSVKGSFTSGSA